MLIRKRFTTPSILLFLMALFLILPSASLYAQDDGYDDDDYYDDEYYDDCYDDDECDYDDYYDDCYDDEECDYDDYDDDYYDDFEGENYEDEDVLARYEVDGTDLVGDPEEDHSELWITFTTLIPTSGVDGVITYFEVIDGGDTAGYVYGDEDDGSQFVLGLNVTELEQPRELRHTIVHEYGHIAMLNSNQVDMEEGGSCPTYELDEGCTEDDSYIYAFYQEFYEDGGDSSSDAFVTEYAESDIVEDMAESFTFFVLRARPSGETVAEEKILFFYNYDELVDLRADIRGNMD